MSSDPNLTAKFGPLPGAVRSTYRVYVVQFVVSALVLTAIQPPFVLTPNGQLSLPTVALVSALAVGVTASTFSPSVCKMQVDLE